MEDLSIVKTEVVIESTSLFYYVSVDINGCYKYVNNHFKKTFRHISANFVGQPATLGVYPPDLKLVHDTVNECILNPGKSHKVSFRKPGINGIQLLTNWEFTCQSNELGVPQEIICIGINAPIHSQLIIEEEENLKQIKLLSKSTFVVSVEPDGVFRFMGINNIDEKNFGMPSYLIQGKTVEEILPEKQSLEFVHYFKRCVNERHPVQFEVTTNNSGLEQHWLYLITPISNVDGNITTIIGNARNVTQDYKSTALLTGQNEKFTTLIESSNMMIWVSDELLNCTFVNNVWYEFSGLDYIDNNNSMWQKLIHPEDFPQALQKYMDAANDRLPFKLEFRFKHYSGEYRWVVDRGYPQYNDQGVFRGYVGTVIDIHDKKLVEESLRFSNRRFYLAEQTVRMGVWDWDLTNDRLHWDEGMFKLFGGSESTFEGEIKNWLNLVHPKDRLRIENVLTQSIKNKTGFQETYQILNETKKIFVRSRASYYFDKTTDSAHIIGVEYDVSHEVAANMQMHEERLKIEELAHLSSQEIRRPLSNILAVEKSFGWLLKGRNEEERMLFELILEESKKIDAVVSKLSKKIGNTPEVDSSFNKDRPGKKILVIDDDKFFNYLTRKAFANVDKEVDLNFETDPIRGLLLMKIQEFDLLLLDINMPEINGFDVLEKLKADNNPIPVVMISSAVDPIEQQRAHTYEQVKGFLSKPLAENTITQLLKSQLIG
ncbi:MAG: hypothetical protein RIQ89_1058 [Bacteroidota bacterium]|jgi:PAS domain S-box-containing protein